MNSTGISGFTLHKRLMTPGYAFVAYVYITFLLAVAGPFDYLVLNPAKVFLYLTYIMVCFFAGYRFSFMRPFPSESLIRPGRKVWVLIGIAFGVVTTTYVVFHGGSSDSLLLAISDPGTAYRAALDANKGSVDVSLMAQIQTLTYGLTMCAMAAVFVGKKRYPGWIIALAWCFPLAQVALAVRLGTFKLLGDWLIFALTIYSLSRARATSRRQKVIMTIAILGFLGAHIYSQESRKIAFNAATGFAYLHSTVFRSDNVVSEVLGPGLYEQIANPIFYVTNGYAGLSAALDEDFVWTYGLGNSMALQSYAEQYFNLDLSKKTYIARAEETHDWPQVYWSTIFPSLASDITFAGCGVLFAFIGFIYPKVYYRAFYSSCPLSTALLFYLNVLLIYVPCNNQVMQVRQQMIAFVGTVLAYWIATKILPREAYPDRQGRFRSTRWNIAKALNRPEQA